MTGAAGAAGGRRGGRGAFITDAHQAEAAGDDPFDRLAGVGVPGQRGILHALHHLETAGGLALLPRDGFINISGHAGHQGGMQILAFSKELTSLMLGHR